MTTESSRPTWGKEMTMSEPFLSVEAVSASYGNISALENVSLKVGKGAIVALLGANGAGKSTTLNVISRIVRPTTGSVRFDGQNIHHLPTDEIVRRGIIQVPEGREVFRDMTVRENLEMGAYTRRDRSGIAQDFENVYRIFPRLRERASQKAATLSGGEQQMLATGRAMMARPRMILLDEPSMGLAPLIIEQIFQTIQALNREQGMTILLVEQNVKLALSVSSYAYILENGEVALEGRSADLQNDEAVQRAYLGA
jgi:branched-chain amino acid transport system ATP-binding protein